MFNWSKKKPTQDKYDDIFSKNMNIYVQYPEMFTGIPLTFRTEEMYIAILENKHTYSCHQILKETKKLTQNICNVYASKYPKKINDIPLNFINKTLHESMVTKNPSTMIYIPELFRTEEMYINAINHDISCITNIKLFPNDPIFNAIQEQCTNDPQNIQYLYNVFDPKMYDIIKHTLQTYPKTVAYLDNFTCNQSFYNIIEYFINKFSKYIHYVPTKFIDIYMIKQDYHKSQTL